MLLPKIFLLALIISGAPAHLTAAESHAPAPDDVQRLIGKVRQHDQMAIIELGRRREIAALPALREIAEEADEVPNVKPVHRGHVSLAEQEAAVAVPTRNRARLEARIALARLGERRFMERFIADISSPDGVKKNHAILHLGEIGDKSAVKFLIPLLDDEHVPVMPPATHGDKVREVRSGMPFYYTATTALEKILPDVARELKGNRPNARTNRSQWKKWWEENKATYLEKK